MVARLSLGRDARLFLTFSAERRNTARDSSAQVQFETLTLRRAAATSFGGGTASSCPLHCPGTNRSRVQTRLKVNRRTLSPQIMSHRGNQRYSGTLFSIQFCVLPDPGHFQNKKCLASVKKLSRRLSIHHGRPNADHRTFFQESPLLHRDKKS